MIENRCNYCGDPLEVMTESGLCDFCDDGPSDCNCQDCKSCYYEIEE